MYRKVSTELQAPSLEAKPRPSHRHLGHRSPSARYRCSPVGTSNTDQQHDPLNPRRVTGQVDHTSCYTIHMVFHSVSQKGYPQEQCGPHGGPPCRVLFCSSRSEAPASPCLSLARKAVAHPVLTEWIASNGLRAAAHRATLRWPPHPQPPRRRRRPPAGSSAHPLP